MKKKWFEIIFSLLVAFVMSLVMSLFMTLSRIGFTNDWYFLWFKAFISAFSVGIPTALILIPLLRKTLERLIVVKDEKK